MTYTQDQKHHFLWFWVNDRSARSEGLGEPSGENIDFRCP